GPGDRLRHGHVERHRDNLVGGIRPERLSVGGLAHAGERPVAELGEAKRAGAADARRGAGDHDASVAYHGPHSCTTSSPSRASSPGRLRLARTASRAAMACSTWASVLTAVMEKRTRFRSSGTAGYIAGVMRMSCSQSNLHAFTRLSKPPTTTPTM